MKDLKTVNKLATRWSKEHQNILPIPVAEFKTGNFITDSRIHLFECESGLKLTIKPLMYGSHQIIDYEIIDVDKYAWFMLKWL